MPPATGSEERQSDRGGDLRYFYICALRADTRTATEVAATAIRSGKPERAGRLFHSELFIALPSAGAVPSLESPLDFHPSYVRDRSVISGQEAGIAATSDAKQKSTIGAALW